MCVKLYTVDIDIFVSYVFLTKKIYIRGFITNKINLYQISNDHVILNLSIYFIISIMQTLSLQEI